MEVASEEGSPITAAHSPVLSMWISRGENRTCGLCMVATATRCSARRARCSACKAFKLSSNDCCCSMLHRDESATIMSTRLHNPIKVFSAAILIPPSRGPPPGAVSSKLVRALDRKAMKELTADNRVLNWTKFIDSLPCMGVEDVATNFFPRSSPSPGGGSLTC